MLEERTLALIRYTKAKADAPAGVEVTERVIIPTFVPRPKHHNVKALDVTALSREEQLELEQLLRDYNEYLEAQRKTLFTFEDFVTHTRGGEAPAPKWRTFKPDQLEEL